ncbi:aspartyl protease APCB1 [Carica papaya]|uniref:aspartyl protease APCB1 n=1 Tax=Carica papaya TaxID=3649 RepID=UPI000B8CF2C1|nr:aspartyl protease APCB1 [Carica papaya]
MNSEDSVPQQLKGVVIITLPPPDNPSLGKTITAFTLTNENFQQSSQSHENYHHNQDHDRDQGNVPIQSPTPPVAGRQFSFSRGFEGTPRKLLGFLAISLLALVLYSCVFSGTFEEFRRSNEDEKSKSFVFPLYHKSGIREVSEEDLEVKLGRFVDVDRGDFVPKVDNRFVKPDNINKMVSANAASGDSSAIFPVRGNVYPDGLYFTYMLVGNPQRTYYLDIDTGSDLTWIQCDAPCTSCAKGANPLYKPRRGNLVPPKDSLCAEVHRNQKTQYCEACDQCDYEIEYADQSSSIGVLARDELHLLIANGSVTKLNVVFGCAYDQQGLLLNTLVKTDGILGLSRAKVSLPSQLADQGIINNVVGHCLTTDVGGGGYMFLGDDLVPQWGMAWVPMLDGHSIGFYHTEIMKMSYGNNPLSLGEKSGRRVLFDTGSSYTYFPEQAYSELVASLEEVSDLGFIRDTSDPTLPICWQAKFPIRSVTDVKQFFKTLTFQLGSKWWIISRKLRFPPESYLIINKKGNVCLGILDGSKVRDGSTIILGDISLRGKLMVYDNVNHRIGWMQSDCVKPNRFKSLPFF